MVLTWHFSNISFQWFWDQKSTFISPLNVPILHGKCFLKLFACWPTSGTDWTIKNVHFLPWPIGLKIVLKMYLFYFLKNKKNNNLYTYLVKQSPKFLISIVAIYVLPLPVGRYKIVLDFLTSSKSSSWYFRGTIPAVSFKKSCINNYN